MDEFIPRALRDSKENVAFLYSSNNPWLSICRAMDRIYFGFGPLEHLVQDLDAD